MLSFVEGVTDPKPGEIKARTSILSSEFWMRPRFMITIYCLFS